MPTTCPAARQRYKLDFIGGVLYGCVPDQALQAAIDDSAQRLAAQIKSDEPLEIARAAQTGARFVKVAAFFGLLNYDMALKNELRDLGEARSAGFYHGIRTRTIADWMQDESRSLHDFVEALRAEYRNA